MDLGHIEVHHVVQNLNNLPEKHTFSRFILIPVLGWSDYFSGWIPEPQRWWSSGAGWVSAEAHCQIHTAENHDEDIQLWQAPVASLLHPGILRIACGRASHQPAWLGFVLRIRPETLQPYRDSIWAAPFKMLKGENWMSSSDVAITIRLPWADGFIT